MRVGEGKELMLIWPGLMLQVTTRDETIAKLNAELSKLRQNREDKIAEVCLSVCFISQF